MKEQILILFNKLNKIIEEKIETGELNKDIKFHSGIIPNKEWKYSSQEEERWYLWLCLVQKWVREKHNLIIEIHPVYINYSIGDSKLDCWITIIGSLNNLDKEFPSYMEALEQAIFNSLQLIINLYEKDKEN